MKKERVAITGLGLVTPAGNDVASTWETLKAGRSQGAPITIFDASGFSTRIAAEVKGFDPRAVIDDRRLLKFANRAHAFALAARLGDGWSTEDVLGVTALCEAIDRGEMRPDALEARLAQRPAA